jgi:hypothetical protein
MLAKRCFSCALDTNGRQTTSAMKYNLEILFILNSVGGFERWCVDHALRLAAGFARCSWQFWQYSTPRKVQMMQMKVPQFAHG